jgi:CheY-like chemotaxis protein
MRSLIPFSQQNREALAWGWRSLAQSLRPMGGICGSTARLARAALFFALLCRRCNHFRLLCCPNFDAIKPVTARVHLRFSLNRHYLHLRRGTYENTPLTEQIAIVDDDESIRRALSRLLTAYSFHVQTYASGREFLDSLKNRIPACLVLDLHMKYEMSGLEVLSHIAGAGLRIPTIIATAQDEPGMRHRCELAGADAFLVKPFTVNSLLETIRSVTASTQAMSS